MTQEIKQIDIENAIKNLDEKLSKRFINLDPKGYFLIKIDANSKEIILEHYLNNIDENGLAIDPSTGKPIKCNGENKLPPLKIYKGNSAKDIGIQITEGKNKYPLSSLDHAMYLGRELQRAEECLKKGTRYIQD